MCHAERSHPHPHLQRSSVLLLLSSLCGQKPARRSLLGPTHLAELQPAARQRKGDCLPGSPPAHPTLLALPALPPPCCAAPSHAPRRFCAAPLQSAAKRYKVTGAGKVMVRRAGKQHLNEKQSRKTKRNLG